MMRAPRVTDFSAHADGCAAEPKFRLLVATVEQAANGIWVPLPDESAPMSREEAALSAFGHGLLNCMEWHYMGEFSSPLLLMLQPVDGD